MSWLSYGGIRRQPANQKAGGLTDMGFRSSIGSLHLKIASGVISTIVLISSVYLLVDYRSSHRQLIGDLYESADQLANISLQSLLELAMLGRHPELLRSAVERLGGSKSVRRILLMDLDGNVRFASQPSDPGKVFTIEDEGCRSCHSVDGSLLPRSKLMAIQGEEVLRSVTSVPNRQDCHVCHGPEQSINGILVIDFSTEEVRTRLREQFWASSYRAGLMVLTTLIVLGVLINKWVLFPIARLTRATTDFREGRQPFESGAGGGSDEIGQLTDSFSRMAKKVQASIVDLQMQQTYLQELIDGLPDGLIVLNREFCVEKTNRAADNIWSRRRLAEMLSSGHALFPELYQALAKTVETGALVTCQLKLEPVAGSNANLESRFLEVYCSPLKDGQGAILSIILLVRDVTRRKIFEMQVSRADRLASVGQLAAGFAHEINNPLAAITTSVEGLTRYTDESGQISSLEKDEIRTYLAVVERAALRCKTITQRLLMASVEGGPSRSDRVDLADALSESVALVQPQARQKDVEVLVRSPSDPGRVAVMGNREKLSQLILNLLLNSLEATDTGGRIEASLTQRGNFVRLEVSDTGCGIPEDRVERIFDPFYTTKTESKGTGLGLSICQWIVRQHDARIQVQSQVGEGTTFSVLFPAYREVSA